MEQSPFPEKYHIVDLHPVDRVIGVALALGRFIGRQTAHLQHMGISEYPKHEKPVQTTRMAQMTLPYDSEGNWMTYADPLTRIHDLVDADGNTETRTA